MSAKKTEFIVTDLISKIFQRKTMIDKLPSQRELAEIYHVSRFTIQKVLGRLQSIGLIYTTQGGGTYINKKALGHPMVYNSLTEVPYEELYSKLLYLKQIEPTAELRRVFNLDAGQKLWEFRRIRIVRYEISQVETGWMPYALFPQLSREVLEDSIQNYALQLKYRSAYFITNYHAAVLDAEHAELLRCKKGLPAMEITSRGVLRDGQIFVYSRIKALQYECTYVSPFNKDVFLSRREEITENA